MKTYLAVVVAFSSLSSARAQQLHNDEDCFEGSELAVFDFFTDSDAEQNGWALVCDGEEKVWGIQVGTLDRDESSWLIESSCIPMTKSCSFTFWDAGEDGLSGNGFLTFRYGATTLLAVEYGQVAKFSELSACFGPRCTETPLEVSDADDEYYGDQQHYDNDEIFCREDEKYVALDIILDENPLETGWSLVCSDETLWNVPPGTLADTAGSWITETICVLNSHTCTFMLFDSSGDGLSSKGYYALRHGATTVAVSVYGTATPFSEQSFCFGPDCSQPPLEQSESDATDTITGTTAMEGGSDITGDDQNDTEGSNGDKTGEFADVEDDGQLSIVAAVLGGSAGIICIFSTALFLALRLKKNQAESIDETSVELKTAQNGGDGDSRVSSDADDSTPSHSHEDASEVLSMSSGDP